MKIMAYFQKNFVLFLFLCCLNIITVPWHQNQSFPICYLKKKIQLFIREIQVKRRIYEINIREENQKNICLNISKITERDYVLNRVQVIWETELILFHFLFSIPGQRLFEYLFLPHIHKYMRSHGKLFSFLLIWIGYFKEIYNADPSLLLRAPIH